MVQKRIFGSFFKNLINILFIRRFSYEGIDLGRFPGGESFTNVGLLRPQPPEEINVQFFLYTRDNTNAYQKIIPSNITQSNFDGLRRAQFIIHGFKDSCNANWMQRTKEELLKNDDFNVICVDWREGSDTLLYSQAASNTRVVGAIVAVMIKQLNSQANAQFNNIHIIGHSLGAHAAGYAGTEIEIDRITGLDPAGPSFRNTGPIVRLDPGDAEFVDVIHTDGERLLQGGFGIYQRVGDADFYPNGGKDQPGCPTDSGFHAFSRLFKGQTLSDFVLSFACDHMRAPDYFIESINSNCLFRACDGTNCSRMGFFADLNRSYGRFTLTTNSEPPYCKNQEKKSLLKKTKKKPSPARKLLKHLNI